MSDKFTITHSEDDTFIPSVAGTGGITLSGKLGKPYSEIQKVVKSAHGAKIETQTCN